MNRVAAIGIEPLGRLGRLQNRLSAASRRKPTSALDLYQIERLDEVKWAVLKAGGPISFIK